MKQHDFLSDALSYAEMGRKVFPIQPGEKSKFFYYPEFAGEPTKKYPKGNPYSWKGQATRDPERIKRFWKEHPNANIGIVTGDGLMVLDLDIDDEKGINGLDTLREYEAKHGKIPDTARVITGRGGYHFYYYSNTDFTNTAGIREGVDVRSAGGYVVAPPSIHPNGNRYEWEAGASPNEIPIATPNDVLISFIKGEEPKPSGGGGEGSKPGESRKKFKSPETIQEGSRVNTLISLISVLTSRGLSAEAIRAAVNAENIEKCNPPLSEEELEKSVFPALTRGWKVKSSYTSVIVNQSLVDTLVIYDVIHCYPLNDQGASRLYASIFKDLHRYNVTAKQWYYYDGKRWILDGEGMEALKDAKRLSDALRVYMGTITDADDNMLKAFLRWVERWTNANYRASVVKDARDYFYFTSDMLDQDDYILNCQNGVLMLDRSLPHFQFIDHSPDLLLSKITNVNYDPGAYWSRFSQFLTEIFGNSEKLTYLNTLLGLCLTGNTELEKMWFLYGATTRNGKSTLIETISYILGDYSMTIRPETLAIKNTDSRTASGDIARLAGARLVVCSEIPKRMPLDVSLLKSLTGRDTITARHLHQSEFQYTPKFKLVCNTNHLPFVGDPTVFSSNRISVISFNRHFEDHEQDKQLKDKLKAEGSGILNYMIAGLVDYYRFGLKEPLAIKQSVKVYMESSDKIGTFISEELYEKPGSNISIKAVYSKYQGWCLENNYRAEGKQSFISDIKAKGIFEERGTVNGERVRNIIKGYQFIDDTSSADVDEDGFIKIPENGSNIPPFD